MKRPTVRHSGLSPSAFLPLLLSLALSSPAVAGKVVMGAGTSAAGQDARANTKTADGDLPVLERFRIFSGQRTTDELTALFNLPASTVVRQQPAIALSDGRTAVIIAARIPTPDGRAMNFSLAGATLVSLKKIKIDEWQIKALPDMGTATMSLIVAHGADTTTYPLTVAPPLPPATDLSDQGFQDYLEKSGDRGTAVMDLNGDGRHDYQDDYIYTANFLAKQQASGREHSARKQRALQRTLILKPAPQKPEFDPSDFPD